MGWLLASWATCLFLCGAALRHSPALSPDKPTSCDDSAMSALRAKIADLEMENKHMRAKIAEMEGVKDSKLFTPAVGLVNSTGLAVASHGTNSTLFPAPDMPSPLPGQPYLAELNMPPTDGAMGHVSIPGSNPYGSPMAYSTIALAPGKVLTYDDITFGYNKLWADLGIWKMQRYKGMRFFQSPTDTMAIQQLIWKVQPDLLIEIGTHGGGSAVWMSEIMRSYNPNAQIVTMDPDPSNIDPNGLFYKTPGIKYLQGLSTTPAIYQQVQAMVTGKTKVMVIQDGDHSFNGVTQDLNLYEPFVTVGSYYVVQDTTLDRAWPSPNNGAMKAVQTFVAQGGKGYGRYGVDKAWEYLLFSTNHNGYLKKINA